MKFVVADEVFEQLENICFGVIVAKGIDNTAEYQEIKLLLDENIRKIEDEFHNKSVKEAEGILPYRAAFTKLGMNPNKFMSSIEALTSRIAKKKGFPNINPIVDLGNAISLKYLVPLGAHDIDSSKDDINVRFSKKGDYFVPFGEKEAEVVDEGELIYTVGKKVKTRRWIWRQSEEGKITAHSKNVFIPIDGFKDMNFKNVIHARDELANLLKEIFDCEIKTGLVDKNQKEIEI